MSVVLRMQFGGSGYLVDISGSVCAHMLVHVRLTWSVSLTYLRIGTSAMQAEKSETRHSAKDCFGHVGCRGNTVYWLLMLQVSLLLSNLSSVEGESTSYNAFLET